ncbi:formate dehydrogenase accessory sulfurtransferase FdhD [Tsukamurella sp. 1534]|uniref:formate dehydrogenase accessory sulfurtransferase FdhD n=1 Tax=Tsukamurella sp. 1534 TaxID=1151061 RepID=UPI00031056F6|nr:formate dehydrogenase accessory sulfurtransferase FdhD [Tsukamurella sp. 1534]
MGRLTDRRRVLAIAADGSAVRREDELIVEEPLELRIGGETFTVTMRTPGHDVELAHGLLLAEGMIGAADGVLAARFCSPDPENQYNTLDVTLRDGTAPIALRRNLAATSSCGVCGKESADAVRSTTRFPLSPDDGVQVSAATVAELPDALRKRQKLFDRTGGVHAAGLFRADGTFLAAREDIGRHNAVDKLLGWALMAGHVPLRNTVLVLSGRVSFELAQKAIMAGVPVVAAVSAPSSLAVSLAVEAGLTITGFVRGGRMNVYTHPGRIVLPD